MKHSFCVRLLHGATFELNDIWATDVSAKTFWSIELTKMGQSIPWKDALATKHNVRQSSTFCWDSNCRSMLTEATALPNVPEPLTYYHTFGSCDDLDIYLFDLDDGHLVRMTLSWQSHLTYGYIQSLQRWKLNLHLQPLHEKLSLQQGSDLKVAKLPCIKNVLDLKSSISYRLKVCW